MMKAVPLDNEHPCSPKATKQELDWRPSSGEGSAAALREVKRMERVKWSWRRVRSGLPPSDDDDDSPAA